MSPADDFVKNPSLLDLELFLVAFHVLGCQENKVHHLQKMVGDERASLLIAFAGKTDLL